MTYWVSATGRAGRFRSLTLVLEGNNPRFPWEPSTTMLTNRLTGTTGAPASDRSEQPSLHPSSTTTELDRSTIFARHGAPSPKALGC